MQGQEHLEPRHWHGPFPAEALSGNGVSSRGHIPAGVDDHESLITQLSGLPNGSRDTEVRPQSSNDKLLSSYLLQGGENPCIFKNTQRSSVDGFLVGEDFSKS